jgi:hypothetical protein
MLRRQRSTSPVGLHRASLGCRGGGGPIRARSITRGLSVPPHPQTAPTKIVAGPRGFEPRSSVAAVLFSWTRAKIVPPDDLNAYPKVRSLVPYPLDEGGMKTWQAGMDLNHRHLPPEGSVLPLNYRPVAGGERIERPQRTSKDRGLPLTEPPICARNSRAARLPLPATGIRPPASGIRPWPHLVPEIGIEPIFTAFRTVANPSQLFRRNFGGGTAN